MFCFGPDLLLHQINQVWGIPCNLPLIRALMVSWNIKHEKEQTKHCCTEYIDMKPELPRNLNFAVGIWGDISRLTHAHTFKHAVIYTFTDKKSNTVVVQNFVEKFYILKGKHWRRCSETNYSSQPSTSNRIKLFRTREDLRYSFQCHWSFSIHETHWRSYSDCFWTIANWDSNTIEVIGFDWGLVGTVIHYVVIYSLSLLKPWYCTCTWVLKFWVLTIPGRTIHMFKYTLRYMTTQYRYTQAHFEHCYARDSVQPEWINLVITFRRTERNTQIKRRIPTTSYNPRIPREWMFINRCENEKRTPQ